ncbi:MAG: hypothetical protein QE493_07455 [Verrucomicrobiae bacterium]|jgi:hypothetical protein|nr:hypothetical protein [Verrucomicrobiae bacterium]
MNSHSDNNDKRPITHDGPAPKSQESTAHSGVPLSNCFFDYKHVGGRFFGLVSISIISLLGCIALGMNNPKQFAFSWLFAFTFFLTICIGSLFWILVHHGIDVEWSVGVRRQMENVATLFPVLSLFFIPLIFVAPLLWKWMVIPHGSSHALLEKAAYLNLPFFWMRAAFYFLFFSLASLWLRKLSVAQDNDGDPKYTVMARKITFASLPFFGVCLTFAAVDWLMGLDFKWVSTMWGVYIFAGSALSSLCVILLIITALRSVGYLEGIVSERHYALIGQLMTAFTVFWAYIGFDQYMLIWYANIPEETTYFLRRNTESWCILNIILVLGHFLVPFILLLFRNPKKRPAYLCGIACWILLMHLLDIYIVVLPMMHPAGFHPSFLDLLSLIAIGTALAAVFLKRLGDVPLWPLRDPRLKDSIHIVV